MAQDAFKKTLSLILILVALCFAAGTAGADETTVSADASDDTTVSTNAADDASLRELQDLLAKQKAQLESQEQKLEEQQQRADAQQKLLRKMQKQLDDLTASEGQSGGFEKVDGPDRLADSPPADGSEAQSTTAGKVDEAGDDNGALTASQQPDGSDDDSKTFEEVDGPDRLADTPPPDDSEKDSTSPEKVDEAGDDNGALTASQQPDVSAKDVATVADAAVPEDQPTADPLGQTPDDPANQPADEPETADLGGPFKGSIRLPDTDSAVKIGGYVKMSLVDTLDPLGSADRFVTASIPAGVSTTNDTSGQFSVSARQSRLNVEIRQATSYGPMRAFIEGDFAGSDQSGNDTYRLRHAFGEFKQLLAGKTWSTFVDSAAQPEEVDFEGINGRINVRQPLLRYFPKIGRDSNFLIALEDPAPDVTGGDGVSKFPDVVLSWRRTWWNKWHIKSSILLRQIEADWSVDQTVSASEFGWGASISGKTGMRAWNERDSILFQFNYGTGLGRYVNDLESEGGQDGVFDPLTGNFKTLKVFAGYFSFQHWWRKRLRSTLTYSWVNVDNVSFQADADYHKTQRVALNLMWSPVQSVDIGAELIWGERVNKNGDNADARQIQVAIKYQF